MRKALLIVAALSFVFCSVSLAEVWLGNTSLQPFILYIIGVLLYVSAFVLFCFRFAQWLRVLARQKIDLNGLNFFRQIEGTRPYQQEAWLQAALVLLIPAVVNIALSFFQQDVDAKIILSIELVLPFFLLLYAIVSTDFERLVAS